VELAPLEVGAPPERVDELIGRQPTRHRVHGEVSPRHVVGDRHGRVGDDLEVAMTRADARLAPRWRDLDSRRCQLADRPVAREEAHTHELAVHLHVLDAPVGREGGAQPGLVDAGDEEVLVGVLDPEQLVTHRAAHDVGVEPERADVAAGRGRHARILAAPAAASYRCAIASISTSAPEGSFATWNVDRAGGRSPTRLA
jgi:hypothetical protein